MSIIGTASIMRHGATCYTGVFPDLAEEGLPMLKKTAKEIVQRFPRRPVFVASPADRAVATALYVMEAYGFDRKRGEIRIEELLAPVSILNPALFTSIEKIVGHLKDDPLERHRALDRFYMESEEFENELLCEPRSVIKDRCIKFLKKLPSLCGIDHHVVAITHIEVIGTVIHDLFGSEDGHFSPAEAAHFVFLNSGQLEVEFRGEIKTLRCIE